MIRLRFAALLCVAVGCVNSQPSAPPTQLCPWPRSLTTEADTGEIVDLSLELVERNGAPTTVTVESVFDDDPFVITPPLLGTEQRLLPYEHALLRQFATPPREGSFKRELLLKASEPCEGDQERVVITVNARDGKYSVAPTALEFDPVPSGTAGFKTIALINDSRGSVRFDVSLSSPVFSLGAQTTASMTVQAHSRTELGIRFAPTSSGHHYGTLEVTAGAHFRQSVALHGVEGGAKLRATPATIDFGKVAYFPTTTNASEGWTFATIANEGSHPVTDPTGGRATFFGTGASDGGFELQTNPLGPQSGSLTVRAFRFSGGQWVNGNLWLDPGETARIQFVASPSQIGQFSTSVSMGGASFFMTASAEIMPPCSISVDSSLDVPLDGGVTDAGMRNIGTERCFIGGMHVSPADAPFELLTTPNELQAGDVFHVQVRARPEATADAGAWLRFTLNSPTTPAQSWPIRVAP